MKTSTKPSPDVINGVYYPSSDGKPMAETGIHVLALMLLFDAVTDFLRGRGGFYVAANIFWYWQEGNTRARCSPDVMVVRGVENWPRRSFRSWQENNAVPSVVFEISSQKTWRNDLGRKRAQYARLGVLELFLFDPEALYLRPPLRGFRLRDGVLEEQQPAADGSLVCHELGVRLIREGQMLRLIDLATAEKVLTHSEQRELDRQRTEQERQRAEQERQRADESQAENERLKQLLATLTQQKNGGPSPK